MSEAYFRFKYPDIIYEVKNGDSSARLSYSYSDFIKHMRAELEVLEKLMKRLESRDDIKTMIEEISYIDNIKIQSK